MTNEEIKQYVVSIYPDAILDESGEWLNIYVEVSNWREMTERMRKLGFDYLFCLTCIDWKTHVTMVYHLTATSFRNSIVVKVKLDRENPVIETICDIWRTAEFHEREVYELFGVKFRNHPDLRRLILTDDFEGYPLRKDFEDAVNMIKL
jgi:NADH-quinone oxidoreductase subunit C